MLFDPRHHVAFARFVDGVARAHSLRDVHSVAVSHLSTILEADGAASLTYDADGVMQFVAWEGLSLDSRLHVESHSPWSLDDPKSGPILVPDIATSPVLPPLRGVLEREGIGALALIPVRSGSSLRGSLMLYYGRPHDFSDAEVEAANAVASLVAIVIDQHRAEASARDVQLAWGAWLEAEQEARARARRTEAQLRLSLEAGRMGTWEWCVPTGEVDWSEEVDALHGLEPGTFGGTIEAFERALHDHDVARVRAALDRAVNGDDQGCSIEYRVRTPAGEIRWLEVRGRVERDEAGRPARVVGVCWDITERRHREEAQRFLSEASALFSASFDTDTTLRDLAELAVPTLADYCAVHLMREDETLHLVEVAHSDPERRERILRLERSRSSQPESLRGLAAVVREVEPRLVPRVTPALLRWSTRDADVARELVELQLRSVMVVPLTARGRPRGTITFISAESRRELGAADLEIARELATRAALSIANAELFAAAQRAQACAQCAAERLELLAEVSAALADSLDPDTTLTRLADVAVGRLADFCVTYALGMRDDIRPVGAAHREPGSRAVLRELLDGPAPRLHDDCGVGRVLRTGAPVLAADREDAARELAGEGWGARHREALDRLAPAALIIVPLLARGRVLGALVFARTHDSGRGYAHEDLVLAEELAGRAGLLVDNARLYREAQQVVQVRDEMVAIVSHDLRNPLEAIASARRLLDLEDTEGRYTARRDTIRRATAQMERLVSDLLEIAPIEAGAIALTTQELSIEDVVRSAVGLFDATAEARGLSITVSIPTPAGVVTADPHRLEQVLCNVLGNAVKFSPDDGEIHVSVVLDDPGVRITIADQGPGIVPDALPRVFERYWRGAGARKAGAGLGLAIAKAIVDAHAGRLEADSRPGEGATFTIWLPRDRARTQLSS